MGRPAIITPQPHALSEPELLARVFRTLGDATRLRVIDLLGTVEEATQSEIILRVGITQSRASEHLTCLVWCGLVVAERRGRTVHYRLTDDSVTALVARARAFVAEHPGALGRQVERQPAEA